MTGWLAGVALAAAVVVSGRPPPGRRLASCRLPGGRLDGRAGSERLRPPVGRGMTWLLAAMLGSALVALRVPPVLLAVIGVSLVLGRRVQAGRRAARARDEVSAATVEVTFALAGELRAGRTPVQALAAVAPIAGPLAPALEAAVAAVAIGGDASVELAKGAELPGAERLRYLAAAWAVADSAGGRVAAVLERLSEAMDSDEELRRELDAAMAGPRATMVLLAGLPVFGLALGESVGAQPLRLLLHRPLGWGLLAAAAALDGLGLVVTRAIARSALRP